MPRKSKTPDSRYDDLVCFNFYVGWRAVQAFYAPHFPDGMNPQRMYVLGMCGGAGSSTTAIARELRIKLPAVSAILSRMERDGLITRERSEHSRREVTVRRTPKGDRLARETDSRLRRADKVLFGSIREVDVRRLRDLTRKIEDLAG